MKFYLYISDIWTNPRIKLFVLQKCPTVWANRPFPLTISYNVATTSTHDTISWQYIHFEVTVRLTVLDQNQPIAKY